jgi:hypothetical protein
MSIQQGDVPDIRHLITGDQDTPEDEWARWKARLGAQFSLIDPKVEDFRECHHHIDF